MAGTKVLTSFGIPQDSIIPKHEHEKLLTERKLARRGIKPTGLTEDVARRICERLMVGESLTSICKSEGMPAIKTVTRWLADPRHAAFRERYYNARRIQAEIRIDEIFDIADDSSNDWKPRYKDGEIIGHEPDNEHIQRSRIRIDTRKWFASKMIPRIYGEKVLNELDVTGDLAELLKRSSNKDNGLPTKRGVTIEHDDE